MIGQEAHYALSVKYGKEGKPVPQYGWADPPDYGEESVPTPVVDAGGNAGLLREGYRRWGLRWLVQMCRLCSIVKMASPHSPKGAAVYSRG